ncbi:MAG: hypothetical protein IT440_05165 [Phycisphaeraceae bacterium]|nr:hypothetical protein [Phycisphaeraceae bacterium]
MVYLPRGVMSWCWPQPLTLTESWKLDLEDIARYQPEGVWWFGSGGLRKGDHVDPEALRTASYATGRAARRALLRQITRFGYGSA